MKADARTYFYIQCLKQDFFIPGTLTNPRRYKGKEVGGGGEVKWMPPPLEYFSNFFAGG